MVQIKVNKGLDIPMKGRPLGNLIKKLLQPRVVSLNLRPFEGIKFRLLVGVGELVKRGQPIAEDKSCPGRMFVSPAGGAIKEIRRGLKRRLLDIIIEVSPEEEIFDFGNFEISSKEQLIEKLMKGGIFSHIRMRPFNLLADPYLEPKAIFIKAVETAPCCPPPELEADWFPNEFQMGLKILRKLTSGNVHLVHSAHSQCNAFTQAADVLRHSVDGPHPAGNASIHIHHIRPIRQIEDQIWVLTVWDVIAIGELILRGTYHTEKVIALAGNGLLENEIGFYKARLGYPIVGLTKGRVRSDRPIRLVSGDILTGEQVSEEDYLGFYDNAFVAIPENESREFLHFFRLGLKKYTATKTYLSGHLRPPPEGYAFTTNQHGEERAFVDGSIYDEVMPLPISTIHLVKAVLAEDYEGAEMLGLLEVDSEDFALPAFICPSKIEMVEIIKNGLKNYSREMMGIN